MKKLNIIVWLVLSVCMQAQEEWISLIAPEKINEIREIDNKYYCATDGGLMIYDPQTKSLKRITLKDGLPSPRIEDIAVDNNGNIWIGTYDNGIAMRIENGWNHIPTPISSWSQNTSKLYCLEFDQFNNLWIGTEEGLFKYVDEEWESILLNSTNSASVVWDMQRDEEGNIYMASHWPFKLQGTEIIEYPNNDIFAYDNACINYDDAGRIYFGTDAGAFAIIDGDEWTVFNNEHFPQSIFIDVEIMNNGDVLTSFLNGEVYKFSNGIWSSVLQTEFNYANTELLKKSNGDLIIGFKDKLYKANNANIEIKEELVDLSIQFPNNNLDIAVNGDQQILLRFDNRLLKFNDSNLEAYEIDPILGKEDYSDLHIVNFHDNTTGFFDHETGNIYYENQTISVCPPYNYFGLTPMSIRDVFADSEGGYWLSTVRGLFYNNQGKVINFDETNTPFPITIPYATTPTFGKISEDRNSNIWVNSPAGIGMWNRITKTWIFYDDDSTNGMSTNLNACHYFDENNVLWASGYNTGLIRFDGSNWSRFIPQIPQNSVLPNYIQDIHPWEDMLILATRGGLAFFDGEDFKYYTTQNSGLSSDFCKTIEQDIHGNIWIAHEKSGMQAYGGISIFNMSGITFSDKDLPQLDIPVVESIIFNEDQLLGMNVYPNPAGKFLNVDVSIFNQKVNKIQLIDEYGKIHFSKNILQGENQLKIYTGNLISGVYILQANAGKQIESHKIIIK